MNKVILVSLVMAASLCGTCRVRAQVNVEKKNKQVISIDVVAALNNRIDMRLSDFADSITYIPLQNLPAIPINWILYTEITPSDLFVYASQNTGILRFDRSGKFLNRIGRFGNGPGELSQGSDFCLSPDEKQVRVRRNFTYNELIFTYDGKFIAEVHKDKFKVTGQTIVISPDRILRIGAKRFPHEPIPPGYYEATVFDKTGKVISQIASPLRNNEKWMSGPLVAHAFSNNDKLRSWYKNRVFIDAYTSDTIYKASSEEIIASYYLNMGKFSAPTEATGIVGPGPYGDPQNYIINEMLFESEDFVIFRARFKGNEYIVRMNKQDRTVGSVRTAGLKPAIPQVTLTTPPPTFNILNDLDGGVSFYPENTNREGNIWISSISALDYKEQIKELSDKGKIDLKDKKNKAVALYHQLKEDDNPVVMMVFLK